MRVWIIVGCAVLIVGAALWPFGRRTEQLAPVPVPPSVATKPPEAPKPEPARIVEVIDLARTYEPVREPEEPAGTVNPASFIQVPDGPRQIPPAVDWGEGPERIDVMPREVEVPYRIDPLLTESEDLRQSREEFHRFWMNNQPSTQTYERLGVRAPIERLTQMPREVPEVKIKREEKERSTGVREDDFVPIRP